MNDNTKKKIKIICGVIGCIILLICVFAGVYWLLSKTQGDTPVDIPQETVSDNSITEKPDTTPTEDEEVKEQTEIDRTPKWEDYSEREYIEGVKDGFIVTDIQEGTDGESNGVTEESIAETIMSIIYNTPDSYAKWYDYSNGFIAVPTNNITPIDTPWESAIYSTIDGSTITIQEANPEEHTIQSLRVTELMDLNFWYHNACSPKDIPESTDVVLGEGLENYWEYYNIIPDQDPTLIPEYQLCYDTIIETYYGEATCIMAYNRSKNSFVGYANIQCANNRILCVKVESNVGDYIMPYILEVAQSGVIMIE